MVSGLKNIVIIHYQALEIFPPVFNCISYLSKENGNTFRLNVITTDPDSMMSFYENDKVDILRLSHTKRGKGRIGTLIKFVLFTIRTLFKLIKLKPAAILYYESHSALPVFAYKRYFNKSVRIFIHYHEYMSPDDYRQPGMRIINYAHSKEKYLYKIAEWISHTNSDRMDLFLKDNPFVNKSICNTMPNFPSREWALSSSRQKSSKPICKMVYVGSFGSFEDLYIEEFLKWVKQNAATVSLDIYSFNIPAHVVSFISELGAMNVKLKGAVNYDSLPLVLKKYNVGIILYKATNLNFKHNAPNKLFEYLGCGLDVWFPEEMTGCYQYIHSETYPKVIKVNFREIESFDFKCAIKRDGLKERNVSFYCEEVLKPLAYKLFAIAGK